MKWLKKQESCPLCKLKIKEGKVKTNYQLKQVIRIYERNKKNEIKEGNNI